MKPTPFLRRFLAIAGSAALTITHAHAATGTWTQTTAGPFNWDDIANWSSGAGPIADGADFTANFTANITAGQVVNLNNAKTIGNITFTDSTTSSNDLTISGANLLTLDRTDLTAPTINVTQAGRTLTISSQIAGNDGLIKSGAGILILGGNNIISGNAVVNGGTLQLSGNNLFGDITVNGATLTSGGTAVGPGTLGAAGGTITFTGTSAYSPQRSNTGAYNKNVDISSGTTTFGMSTQYYHESFSGVFSGAGTLVKNDSNGVLTFSNSANTFTGAIRLDTGVGGLVVNSLADSANAITFNGNTGALSLGAGTASSLLFDSRQIVLAHANGGEITNNNGSASNTIIINTNLGFSGAGTRLLELGGTNVGANAFNGNITNNGGSATAVTKSGSGTWTLSGTNTYSGATGFNGVQNGGTLILSGAASASVNTTFSLSEGSTLGLRDDTAGTVTFGAPMQVNLTSQQTSARATSNIDVNRISTGTGSTLAIGKLNFAGITDNRAVGATVNVKGGNGYSLGIGSIDLDWGINGSQNLNPTTASVTVTGTVQHINGRPVTGTVVQGQAVTTAGMTFTLDGTSTGNLISGAIKNAADFDDLTNANALPLNLTKSSASTWTLSGTNTYTGTTSVSAGRLIFNGNSSGVTGNVTVSGGTLGGNGSLGGAVTVSSTGGIDLRDNAVGTLTLGSTLGITGAAGANNLHFNLGNNTGTSDQISLAGTTTVTTAGSAVVNLNQLGGLAGRNATTYTLIGGAGTLDATNFAKFSLATTKAFGQTYQLLNGGTNGDLQLQATNVIAGAGNVTLQNSNPSWTSTANFSPANLPDYESNVTINSAIGITGALNASQDINSLNYGTLATTNTTIISGTAAAGTPFNMMVIEAAGVNGNTAGNGITLSNTSGTHSITANIGLAASQTWTIAGTTGGLTVSGVISDFGLGNSLTKAGGGTLAISTAPTYTGSTTISGGTLDMSGFAPASYSTSSFIFSGNSTLKTGNSATLALPNITVNSGVTATFDGGGGGNNTAYTMSALTSGSSTSKFVLTSNGGSGRNITFGSLAGFTGTLEYNIGAGGGFSINTPDLTDTAGTFVRMSTPNTSPTTLNFNYTGSSNLTLDNRQFELFGTTANATYNINNNGSGTFTINPSLLVSATGNKILALGGTNATANTFGGSISDGTSAIISVTKNGAGSWTLGNTGNAFTGAITVNAGTLAYASAGGANGISFTNTTGAATLNYTGATDKTMSGAINASTVTSGTVNLLSSGAGAINYSNGGSLGSATSNTVRNLILSGTNTGNNIFAGQWVNNTGTTNAATLTKNGAGKWILSGSNTYTGATTVAAGTLAVNGSLANTATTVQHGAILQGSGTIGGSVTIQFGGALAPGNSIESIGTGTLTLNTGSTFAYEIDSGAAATVAGDLTYVTGNLNLATLSGSLLTISELGTPGAWSVGEKLTLISYTGAWNNELFNYFGGTLADDSNFTLDGVEWTFNYNDTGEGTNYATDSNGAFVTMTVAVVPEPGAALIGSLGLLVLLRRRRN